jgi:hypothetical protein
MLAEAFKVINIKIIVTLHVNYIIQMFWRNLSYPFYALSMETTVIAKMLAIVINTIRNTAPYEP